MYFKQILNEEAGRSSYVIASRQSLEAVVVDPSLDIDQYVELATSRRFEIKLVIDTHVHADHVSGARKLAAAAGAEVALHESADLLFDYRGLANGGVIKLGQLRLEILHTPGHRPESLSVLLTNPPRGEEPSMVLTGDCLFVGDVGRPDFGGASGARQQFHSVQRLLQLSDYVGVFPAHFEGSCGKGMCGRPSSTIGFERRFNAMTALSEESFIESASEAPARPLNMTAILATNRSEADLELAEPHMVSRVPEIAVEQAPAWMEEHSPIVLDVREPDEFAAAHIPGALSIPQSELVTNLDLLSEDREVLVVCAGGVRSIRAANYLLWLGDPKVTSLTGGTDGWTEAGYPTDGPGGQTAERRTGLGQERYFHAAS